MADRGFVGSGDDQDRLLDEATAVVKEQAFYMKRAIDNDNLREALKHSSNLICELRTALLSPKNYYELYCQVFQEMQHLAAFFSDKSRHGRKMIDLYESVQHAGNILPRLYLLATVGASYIKSKEAPAKEILKDMNELTKGVQHPMRGLFLRYYMSQMVKDKLPDTGTEYEAEGGGNIDDAFDFILTNFQESNRLWVRMQNQGPVKDKSKREKERHDLRVLVGANLVRLSQLDGVTVEYYAESALPKILDHVLSVKDTMSQQYLFESMIQVFPDEFHIRTLEQVLASYTKAQPSVDMKPIMVTLMRRLSDFLQNAEGPHALSGVDIFALFRTHLQAILERTLEPGAVQGAVPDIGPPLEVQAAFMQFTLSLYPDKIHYVDIILHSTVEILQKYFARMSETSSGPINKKLASPGADKVVDLLSHPLKTLSLQVFEMEHYTTLLGFLSFGTRKQVSLEMVSIVVEDDYALNSVEAVNNLFGVITPLLKDEEDTPNDEGNDKVTFAAEQHQVCKLVHQVRGVDTDTEMSILNAMRAAFGQGGPQRMGITLQPIIYRSLGLVSKILKRPKVDEEGNEIPPPATSIKKVFQFVHKTITALVSCNPEMSLQLWLLAGTIADKVDHEPGNEGNYEGICYEFVTQALINFEEEISESSKQYQGIYQLVGTLSNISCLEAENYDTVCQKIVQHSARLLKKPMQCRAIATAAQLYFSKAKQEGKRVLECLQKCLKIVDNVVQSDAKQVVLWVEMLDKYIYYYEMGCEDVTAKYIQSLLNLCHEHITFAQNDSSATAEAGKAKTHLSHTINYIRSIQKSNTEAAAKFAELEIEIPL